MCDLKTSRMRRTWPTGGCCAKNYDDDDDGGGGDYDDTMDFSFETWINEFTVT